MHQSRVYEVEELGNHSTRLSQLFEQQGGCQSCPQVSLLNGMVPLHLTPPLTLQFTAQNNNL